MKKRGRPFQPTLARHLKNFMHSCNIQDIWFIGPTFTWKANSVLGHHVRERLDWGLGNQRWMSLYPNT